MYSPEESNLWKEAGVQFVERNDKMPENYDVIIETLDSGYLLRVGCKKFAIADKNILINMLTKYFTNPAQIKKQFRDKTLEIK
jgi:hypothetical protein